MIHLIGGGHFEKGLSKGSNAFILTNSKFRKTPGWAQGNVAGLRGSDINKRVLREELLHNWQYRRGGLLSLTRLGIIERIAEKTGSNPYDERKGSFGYKYLEHQAQSGANLPYNERPWELRCSGCDKFY